MAVRILFWIALALLLRFVLRSLLRASTPLSAREGRAPASDGATVYKGLMVRDPVCGLHLPESRALVELRAGERFHFCSNACRNAFRSSPP